MEANPDSADNVWKVDYTKYDQNFWYRTTFIIPSSFKGKTTWINFEASTKRAMSISTESNSPSPIPDSGGLMAMAAMPDGTQPLYNCMFTFTTDNQLSDKQTQHFGIRQYSYDTLGGPLHVLINDKRVFLKGGNWGMSDYLLRCRDDEYDTKIRFHKEMNFNMIRNWTGEVTDEEFYDACDKWGIIVWDDFWLNNLGPIDSLDLFIRNAVEKVKCYRNHPSIAIWCGANEGLPQNNKNSPLNTAIANTVAVYDGNDRR